MFDKHHRAVYIGHMKTKTNEEYREEVLADRRETMARDLFDKINHIERPDIVIALICKTLDEVYKQKR